MSATSIKTGARNREPRFPILDALRFILAFWVTLGHVGLFPLFAGVDTSTSFGRFLAHGWNSLVWGVPAVIGFFVISGFCIHLPFRRGENLPVGRYYARRYTRILVPVVAAILLNRALGDRQAIFGQHSVLWNSVLWSLACEEIYYAVYPLARMARNRWGWPALLTPAFIVGAGMALRYPNALDGSILGMIKTSVILYPIWLLGGLLAEQSDRLLPLDARWTIWKWRFFAWFGSWAGEMLHFKGKLSQELVMLCFGILAYFWIKNELTYGVRNPPYRVLAWAGLWSYSLYLLHGPATTIYWGLGLPRFNPRAEWFVLYAAVLAISFLFYFCVERPSHRMARRIRISPAKTAVVTTNQLTGDSAASAVASGT